MPEQLKGQSRCLVLELLYDIAPIAPSPGKRFEEVR